MPIQRPFSSDRNRSRHPSTAVQYALIGVYDKLLHPQKLPCLLYLFTRIICVVLSCFILLVAAPQTFIDISKKNIIYKHVHRKVPIWHGTPSRILCSSPILFKEGNEPTPVL